MDCWIRERNHCAMGLSWWRNLLLLLVFTFVCSLEQVTHNPQNNVFCPQGLSNCSLKHTDPLGAHDTDCGRAYVCSLKVEPKLCCYDKNCKPCLWINIQLSFIPEAEDEEDGGESGYEDEKRGDWDAGCVPDDTLKGQTTMENSLCEDQLAYQGMSVAAVTICYTSAGKLTLCKRLNFIMTSGISHKSFNLTLVEYEDVHLGGKNKISVGSSSRSAEVEIPTLKTVCSSPLHEHIMECKGPRVNCTIQGDVVKLDYELKEASEPLQLCMKRGKEGKCWGLSSNIIPLKSVTDCMCFQAWKGSTRTEFCPFEQSPVFKENVLRNVSVFVYHTKTNDDQPVLAWNLSAPCRLDAELWPCQLHADGQCKEIHGFRQQSSNETQWEENITTLWTSGKFVNINSRNHQQLCVTLHTHGESPRYYCQHPLERHYWSLLIPLALIVVCLTICGIYLVVNKIKWWISGWERQCHSQDTRGQVLLLHLSTTDHQSQLVCRLSRMFSELGFSVSLDLLNLTEISSLGPAPWFHSKLGQIQKHGGKVLLMVSPSTLQSAEWYSSVSNRGKEEINRSSTTCSSDVLVAALGCISADRQKGGAAPRFVLVQLNSNEHLINEEGDMPKLLRGLPLYKLPSQTQGLLGELCMDRPNSLGGKLKKMWWMKRARRKFSQELQNDFNSKKLRTESMLTQEDSLSLDMEEFYLKKEQL
ncbi:interleukin-17 receptor C isoform X1 [Paramisgurnus dabryanus]|uniref:interleukin-17 receptor C isoform X1 n=1 Tax=Paramisgurnus dabryanus TaxID=90735 RepID=UPI0031F3FB00